MARLQSQYFLVYLNTMLVKYTNIQNILYKVLLVMVCQTREKLSNSNTYKYLILKVTKQQYNMTDSIKQYDSFN